MIRRVKQKKKKGPKKMKRADQTRARARYEEESRALKFEGGPSEAQKNHPAFRLLYQHFQYFLQQQAHPSYGGVRLPSEVPRDA